MCAIDGEKTPCGASVYVIGGEKIPRGTTPTNYFNVDLDLTEADAIYITYVQKGEVVFEKDISDITVEAERLSVKLTQEDTLKLDEGEIEIQIRAKMSDGTVVASNIVKTTASRVLKDGVI